METVQKIEIPDKGTFIINEFLCALVGTEETIYFDNHIRLHDYIKLTLDKGATLDF